MTPAERQQIEAELSTLSPGDVVKAASAQAVALAKKNASVAAAAARREADAVGNVVVVGSTDGELGAQLLALFEAEAEAGEMGGKGVARVASASGVSLADVKALLGGGAGDDEKEEEEKVRVSGLLKEAKTLVIIPAQSGKKKKGGGGGGGGLAGLFGGGGGGGGGGGDGGAGDGLSDEEVTALLDACRKELKHVLCLSIGSFAGGGGGGGGLFGSGGNDDKLFPAESSAEQVKGVFVF